MSFYEIHYIIIGISVFLHVFVSIKICRALCYLFMLFKQISEKERIYIYPFNLKSDVRDAFFKVQNLIILIWPPTLLFYPEILREHRVLFVFIFICIAILHFTTHPDKKKIRETNNLQIGYGAAIAYYKNYLEMTLTERFSERIDKFKSENMIQMPKILFILVPRSCAVYPHLDSIEQENIERCRELPEEVISHSGIKHRKYNITIYNINGLRMAVEFAQPLKALYLLKEKGLLTMDEMLYERKIFTLTLRTFQEEDPYKYFEIIEYDDSVDKIHKVLTYSHNNPFKRSYDLKTV